MSTNLRTARLVLNTPRESDIDAVYAACQDAAILRAIPLPIPYTIEHAEFFVRSYVPHGEASGSYVVFAIRAGDDDPLLGVIEVRKDEAAGSASMGCWLAPISRGHGYMYEALARVVAYALAANGLGFSRLRWEYLVGNTASERLATSLGFIFDSSPDREIEFRGERVSARVGMLSAMSQGRFS